MKRILKFIGCLALGCVGLNALAAEVHVSDAAGLKNAFANATAGTTIVLDADITTTDHLSCSKGCVLDLAGHKIVGDYSSGDQFASGTLINVTGATSFKLISSTSGGGMSVDGVKSFTGKYNGVAVNLSSTATATFGEADGSNANFTLYGAYQGMNVSGTVIFNGGSFVCGADGVAVQLQAGCNVVLNGGSISSFKGLDSANISIGVGKALACLTSGGKMQLCDIPAEGLDLSYGQIIIGVANGQTYKVKQSSAAENKNQLKICAAENTTATVVLDGLCCNNSDTIVCDSGAGSAIVLELDNDSTLTGGIRNVGEGELVIQDENGTAGSIKITASNYCAAIGGNQVLSPVGKNITIKSGTIECESVYGAAIGGGGSDNGNAVNIKILGGTVMAKSERGAAIGGGTDGHAENVIISGGKVVASSDRGKAVGDGFQSSGSTGISISCGTYSPAPTADMIAAGYEVIEKDGEFIIGVKTEDDVVITTDTQETKVEVPTEVVEDEEVAKKIAQGTKVEGVKLTAKGTEQEKGGVQTVVDEATKDQTFAAAVAAAAEVSVKVEVDVEPTEFDNTANKGKVAFKLTPKAVVSVGEGEGKLEREVPVSNDMIDQSQKFAVSIYTGFRPVAITHDDEDGYRIETFEGEQISFNEATGVATVLISHFSTVTGFGLAEEVPPAKFPPVAKIGDVEYETLDAAFGAAKSGETVVILNGEHDCTADNAFAKLCAKTVTLKGESQAGTILNMGTGNKTGVQTTSGPGTHLTLEDMTLKFDHSSSGGSPMYDHTFYHPASQTFRRVTIVGQIDIMDDTLFDTCTFTGAVNNKDEYLLWCYGCKAELVNCKFTGSGTKAPIKLYNEGAQCGLDVAKTIFEKVGSYDCAVYSSNKYPNNNVYEITVGENVTVPEESEKGLIRSSDVGLTVINPTKDENGKYTGGTFESEKKSAEQIVELTKNYAGEGFVPAINSETGKVEVELDPITGSGTEADPYVIKDLKGLKAFRDRVNAGNTYAGKFFVLDADIDLNNENWEPIGTATHPYAGNGFDGQNHTISNLYIHGVDLVSQGLFGKVSHDQNKPAYPFKNLTIVNVDIDLVADDVETCGAAALIGEEFADSEVVNVKVTGSISIKAAKWAGGIVGWGLLQYTDCTVEDTTEDGGVIAAGYAVGGIAGGQGYYSVKGGKVTNCSVSNVTVLGDQRVGGLVGINNGGNHDYMGNTVQNVKLAENPDYGYSVMYTTFGKLLGCDNGQNANMPTRAIDNDVKVDTCVIPEGVMNIGGNASGVKDPAAMAIVGWNVTYDNQKKIIGGTFEQLPTGVLGEGCVMDIDPTTGKITVLGPLVPGDQGVYHIATMQDLKVFRLMVNGGNTFAGKTVVLDNDIEFAGEWNSGIGSYKPSKPFMGVFDGCGNKITGLKIVASTEDEGIGLFGYLSESAAEAYDAMVKNLTLENAAISGKKYVGGIVGYSWRSKIETCKVVGSSIVGGTQVGGILGRSQGLGRVSGCEISASSVTGMTDRAGGIVGVMQGGNVVGNSVIGTEENKLVISAAAVNAGCGAGAIVSQIYNNDGGDNTITDNNIIHVETKTAETVDFVPVGNLASGWYQSDYNHIVLRNHWEPKTEPDYYDMQDFAHPGTYTRVNNFHPVAQIEGKGPAYRYEKIAEACAAVEDNGTIIIYAGVHADEGTDMFAGLTFKTVTLRGAGQDKTTLKWTSMDKAGTDGAGSVNGYMTCDVTFEDLKFEIERKGANMDQTLRHPRSATYRRVTISGEVSSMDPTVFENCTFTGPFNEKDEYLVWNYGSSCVISGCTFQASGSHAPVKQNNPGCDFVNRLVVTDTTFLAVGDENGVITSSSYDLPGYPPYDVQIDLATVTIPTGANYIGTESGEWASTGVTFVNGTTDANGKYKSGVVIDSVGTDEQVERIVGENIAYGCVMVPYAGPVTGPVRGEIVKLPDVADVYDKDGHKVGAYVLVADALKEVPAEGRIVLLANSAEDLIVTRTDPFTLDRNGKAFTGKITMPNGYALKDNGDGTYSYYKMPIATITRGSDVFKYDSLGEACTAAVSGDTIVLSPMIIAATSETAIAGLNNKRVVVKGAGMDVTTLNWGTGKKTGPSGADFGTAEIMFQDLAFTVDHANGEPYKEHFKPMASLAFKGVKVNGMLVVDNDATFDGCKFTGPRYNSKTAADDEYLLWLYKGKLTVVNCTFPGTGTHAPIKLNSEPTMPDNVCALAISNCTFEAIGDEKGAIVSSCKHTTPKYTKDQVYDVQIDTDSITIPDGAYYVGLESGQWAAKGVTIINGTKDKNGKYVSGVVFSSVGEDADINRIVNLFIGTDSACLAYTGEPTNLADFRWYIGDKQVEPKTDDANVETKDEDGKPVNPEDPTIAPAVTGVVNQVTGTLESDDIAKFTETGLDDAVVNEDGTMTEKVAEAVKKAAKAQKGDELTPDEEKAIEELTNEKNRIEIELKTMGMKVETVEESKTVSLSIVKYDVIPKVKVTTVITGVEEIVETVIPNSALVGKPLTFRLAVNDNFGDFARVDHTDADGNPVENSYITEVISGKIDAVTGKAGKYVELKSEKFSFFTVSAEVAEPPVCKVGDQLYSSVSNALEAVKDVSDAVITLTAPCDETNLPLKWGQVIDVNGQDFKGSIAPVDPEGNPAAETYEQAKTPDGLVFSAPKKIEVPTTAEEGAPKIKVRLPLLPGMNKEQTIVALQAIQPTSGRPLWADKVMGTYQKLIPFVPRSPLGRGTVTIKTTLPDDTFVRNAVTARDGVSVKYQLKKRVGNGDFLEYGDVKAIPVFTVEASQLETRTSWKIETIFDEEY